jgi:tetratricopeptide (TPR) repeat protein
MSYGQLRSSKLCTDGRFEEAIAAATEEIAADPGEPEPLFNRGQALAGLERFAEAAADYEAALGMDASGSALDPETLDDELFFALRSEAVRTAAAGDRPGAIAILRRYQTLVPAGRHRDDVPKWIDKINGVETVWYRERA